VQISAKISVPAPLVLGNPYLLRIAWAEVGGGPSHANRLGARPKARPPFTQG